MTYLKIDCLVRLSAVQRHKAVSVVSFPGSCKSQAVFQAQACQSPTTMRRLSKSPVWQGVPSCNLEIQEISWNVVGDVAPLLVESHLLCGKNFDIIVARIWSCWIGAFGCFLSILFWPLVLSFNHQI